MQKDLGGEVELCTETHSPGNTTDSFFYDPTAGEDTVRKEIQIWNHTHFTEVATTSDTEI